MEWTRGPVLGRGSTATVSTTTSTSGDLFAVKSVDFHHAESLRKEQHFLSVLQSPYVVSYKGCDITTHNNNNNKMVYNLFMEYMSGGSIIDLINRRNNQGLNDFEIARYTRHILQGLEYIHSKGIVHCDIKGRNILVNESGAKIGDFGCAKWANQNPQPAQFAPVSGTPMFMAPEVARGEEQGFSADIWAVGCTVIEMATGGGSPWSNVDDPVSVLYRIAYSGEVPGIPDGLSDKAKDFVGKCLIRDPRRRWTAAELLKHPYVVEQLEDESIEMVCETMRTDSPTSVLEQDVWNWSSVGVEFGGVLLSESLRQRMKQLAGESEMPNWRCEKGGSDWMTVRW